MSEAVALNTPNPVPSAARSSLPAVSVFASPERVAALTAIQPAVKDLSEMPAPSAAIAAHGVVIVETSHDECGSFLEFLASNRPQTAAIVVGDDLPANAVRALLQLDVSDVISSRATAEDLIKRAQQLNEQMKAGDGVTTKCWAYTGAVGGAGVTTIAIESAFAVARRAAKPSVCFVDLNLADGMAAAYLDGQRRLDLGAVCRAPERLDADVFEAMSWKHPLGVTLVSAPRDPDAEDVATNDGVLAILDTACSLYDHVFLDLPRHRQPWTQAVLTASDEVMVVSELTIPSLHAAADTAGYIDRLRDGGEETRILLNRMINDKRNRHAISIDKAERAIGRNINATVSSDWDAARSAVNLGKPVADVMDNSSLVKDVVSFVDIFAPSEEAATGGQGKSKSKLWSW